MLSCQARDRSQPGEESDETTPRSSVVTENSIDDLSLHGFWRVERPDGMTLGTLAFSNDGRYTLIEQRLHETTETHVGSYTLDATSYPTKIELTPDGFEDADQSSFLTRGTISFLSSDRVEMAITVERDPSIRFEENPRETSIFLTRIY